MAQSNRFEHDAKIQELKAGYERDGYEVLVAPDRQSLPFDLDNYVPDLLARKPDGGLIIDVKTANARVSIERYQSVARTVQQHRGWRFLLVTVDDLNIPASAQQLPSWSELAAKLDMSRSLMDNGNAEPAILYLWSIWEAAMRKLAGAVALPIERLPATKLMNQFYTLGYISIDDFTTAKQFLIMRDCVTHGFNIALDGPLLESFFDVVSGFIREWKNERFDSEMLGA